MSTVAVVVIVIIALAVIAGAALYLNPAKTRTRRLRSAFGPEYDRALERHENPQDAEQELLDREERYAKLDVRALDTDARAAYEQEWMSLQERFVDSPRTAVVEADRLIAAVMSDRGLPTGDFEQQAKDLSVEYAPSLAGYRAAHETAVANDDTTSTEDLRRALVDFRTLFFDMIGAGAARPGRDVAAARKEQVK